MQNTEEPWALSCPIKPCHLGWKSYCNIPKLAWRLVFWSSWRAGHLDNLCFWMFGLISSTGLLDIVQSINDADLQQLKSKVVKTHHVWQYFAVTNYGIVWSLWCLWKDGRSQNPKKGCCDSIFLSWKLHFFQCCKLIRLWHMIEESMAREFAKWKVTKLLLKKRRSLFQGLSEALSDLFCMCDNIHGAGSDQAQLDWSCAYKTKA